jgi:hypothetical protein
MGKEMRMRGWKKKYQEDEKEGRKKKILSMQGIMFILARILHKIRYMQDEQWIVCNKLEKHENL